MKNISEAKITMKKTIGLISMLVLASNMAFGFMETLEPQHPSFGPRDQLRPAEQLDFGKPSEMVNILPNRPVSARDKNGNRVYYTPGGSLVLSVSRDGSMSFSVKGKTVSKDAEGNITQTVENIQGTGEAVVKNAKGEVTGYREYGLGGKTVGEFDAEGNKIKSYKYDTYGKNLELTVDELTMSKTVFNYKGQPSYDENFEGARIAEYAYDDDDRLLYKEDNYKNKTYFNSDGNLTYTENANGEKMAEYSYKFDEEGRYILDKMTDVSPGPQSGDVTYFKNGRAVRTDSRFGGTAKEYHYDGTKLVFTFDTRTNETTWYDVAGKQTKTTFNENLTKEWLYHKSRLVGYFDELEKTVTMFKYERVDQVAKVYAQSDRPTAKQLEEYYEQSGQMHDVGESNVAAVISKPVTKMLVSAPRKLSPTILDNKVFNTVAVPKEGGLAANTGVQKAKYNYSAVDGRLESVLSEDLSDGAGMVTQIFIDLPNTSSNERTAIILSGDQTANAALVKELWKAVVDGAKNIGDISAEDGELAKIAQKIKNISINARVFSELSDAQICNLFGWNRSASATQKYLSDVIVRAENAGTDGTVNISLGGSRVYAHTISAIDADQFYVAGLTGIQNDNMLYLASEADRQSVAEAGGSNLASSERRKLAKHSPSTERTRTVNGVTRTYSDNGNILTESSKEGMVEYDNFGKRTKIYDRDGNLAQSFTYARNGALKSVKTMSTDQSGRPEFVTTFYVGWGAAGSDQPSITVWGDQENNAELAAKLWDAVNSGSSINDITNGRKNTELTSFARTIQFISVNPAQILKMENKQISELLGLSQDAAAFVKNCAYDVGISATLTIGYTRDSSEAYQIQIDRGSGNIATLSLRPYIMEFEAAGNIITQAAGIDIISEIAANLTGNADNNNIPAPDESIKPLPPSSEPTPPRRDGRLSTQPIRKITPVKDAAAN